MLRLASVLWRLRRASGIESGIFESATEGSSTAENPLAPEAFVKRTGNRLYLVGNAPSQDETSQGDREVKITIADRFLRLAELHTYPLDRLSRYEHFLSRQARDLVLTLEIRHRRNRLARRPRFL